MFRLVDACNTWNPALLVIREKGYHIGIYEPTYDEGEKPSDDDRGHFYARKASHEFVAGDPLSLLGLITIWESRGEDWSRDDDPEILFDIEEEPWP